MDRALHETAGYSASLIDTAENRSPDRRVESELETISLPADFAQFDDPGPLFDDANSASELAVAILEDNPKV